MATCTMGACECVEDAHVCRVDTNYIMCNTDDSIAIATSSCL